MGREMQRARGSAAARSFEAIASLARVNAGIERGDLEQRLCLLAIEGSRSEQARLLSLVPGESAPRLLHRASAWGSDRAWGGDRAPGGVLAPSVVVQSHGSVLDLADLPLVQRAVHGGETVWHRSGVGNWGGAYPVRSGGQVVACMELQRGLPLRGAQHAWLEAALSIYGQHLEALDYAERDSLTGLLNRKTFVTTFERLARAAPARDPGADPGAEAGEELVYDRRTLALPACEAAPTWLGMFDLDHFKQVNDVHGHMVGDEALLHVGRTLVSGLRANDSVFRFGGEEFVVVLAPTREEDAVRVFDRLRERIAATELPRIGRVTTSVGYTRLACGDVPPLALERADRAMYFAKQAGRNRCEAYEALLAAGAIEPPALEGEAHLF
jgi:diguanylate cyclase (GGDEF)-like protein